MLVLIVTKGISIHALRVEGDLIDDIDTIVYSISIHALRVEGDFVRHPSRICLYNFYPRPPGGGRLQLHPRNYCCWKFLSTPSGWRATKLAEALYIELSISIHALRVEGDNNSFSATAGSY